MDDPLRALARLIGQDHRYGRHHYPQWGEQEYPSVRQLPWSYYTLAHGPVFAFQVTSDGRRARAVTWNDRTVECRHEELLPFRDDVEGADVIETLDAEISEAMSPNMDDRMFKYYPPRRSTVGEYLFGMNLFSNALHPAEATDE